MQLDNEQAKPTLIKKLNPLLDDVTIISFPFIFKLISRYFKFFVLLTLGTLVFCAALFLSQKKLYNTSIGFYDNAVKASDSKDFMLHNLKANQNSRYEKIISELHNVDFMKAVAMKLYGRKDFVRIYQFPEIKARLDVCQSNRHCIIEKLQDILPSYYRVIDNHRKGGNFILNVNAYNKELAGVLIEVVRDTITENRIYKLKKDLKIEEDKVSHIIEKYKMNLDEQNFNELRNEEGLIRGQLDEVNQQLKIFGKVQFEQTKSLAALEASLNYSSNALKKNINLNQLDKQQKRDDLQNKIDKITEDIYAIENAGIEVTDNDKMIIAQLRESLAKYQVQLKKIGPTKRSVKALRKFIKKSDEKMNTTELNYRVHKDQIKKLNKQYRDLLLKRSILMDKSVDISMKLETLMPTFESLTKYENQLINYKLLEKTVASDLKFDKFPKPVRGKRKISVFQMAVYTLILLVVISIFGLVFRYFRDDKVYELSDITQVIGDVNFIGQVPEYENA